jgi:mannan endo-1,4-beta-mannosidase
VRFTIPKLLALGFSVLLAGYVFLVAPRMHAAAARHAVGAPVRPSPTAPAVPVQANGPAFPSAGHKFIGIMTNGGPYDFTDLDKFTRAVGHQPSVYEFGQGWAVNQFNASVINAVARRGMLPLISWEPWDYRIAPMGTPRQGDQPAYSLSTIISGRYDRYIRSWAEGVKSLGYPIALRFAHEMNGNWYPWAVFANGNEPRQYVQAWRHVHDIFTQVGATNVIWVWSPNIIWNTFTDLGRLYPGNSYVDWIGLSGYYGTPGMQDYKSFDQTFDQTITDLRTFTSKPLIITETGATNVSGEMAPWITQMFQELPARTDIIGVIWFEAFNVIDWKVADDLAASHAFAAGLASPVYQTSWRPGMGALPTAPIPQVVPGGQPTASTSQAAATTAPAAPPVTRPSSPAAPRPAPSTPHPPTSPPAKPTPTPSPIISLP